MLAYVRTPSVPVEIHVFHFNKSCFQLEDALASGSRRSPNLGDVLSASHIVEPSSVVILEPCPEADRVPGHVLSASPVSDVEPAHIMEKPASPEAVREQGH